MIFITEEPFKEWLPPASTCGCGTPKKGKYCVEKWEIFLAKKGEKKIKKGKQYNWASLFILRRPLTKEL